MNDAREDRAAAAKARMNELALKFIDRTAGDVARMRECLAQMAAGDPESLADLRHLAHRMVGTGATLGFEAISEHALCLEQLAEGCAPGSMPDDTVRRRMALALEALEAQLRQPRGT
jgi:HPt (histidine-containing phosphotransfer) domain-containing protein